MAALLTLLLLFIVVQIWLSHASPKTTGLEAEPDPTKELVHQEGIQPNRRLRLRYLAVCPRCGERLTRRDYFTWKPQFRRKCRKCDIALKSDLKLDFIWSFIMVSPFAVCFFLALTQGNVSWFVVILSLLFHFVGGYVLFPYNTKLQIADGGEKSDSMSFKG